MEKNESQAVRIPWILYTLIYKRYVRRLQKKTINPQDIVFLGDSLTRSVNWQRFFPNVAVHNFGISGDTSFGVLARLHQVTSSGPMKIFLLIGTNELYTYKNATNKEVLNNTVKIIDVLKTASPPTKIYVQSIMPRHKKWGEEIGIFNHVLKHTVSNYGAEYIDLWPALADDSGGLKKEFTVDFLHLNNRGKKAWVNHITEFVL
ncbi:GDSL-type esterase/lipase family protein [Chitinispirillales bacterium ANBcel5]|uniref:GDSL-type esterase/lipase family protein n=1 Tax=Cellulosispirillum alkaliphilum TaxID=3039283 RepID=UPI002A5366BB|nr:GDSL-type esterase/lipase family protein [Chitinispirillales bacterium ANBcel5]